MKLLKDLPEFKETIEGNLFFKNDIADSLEDVDVEISFAESKDEIITEIVGLLNNHCDEISIGGEKIGESIKDKQILAIAIFEAIDEFSCDITVTNKSEIADEVIDKMSIFVKENYGISIKEAYLQSMSIL